jgi:GAF domain-containing protein
MSRAARLTLSATAWMALGAAAFFVVTTEQKVADRRNALRTFDRQAREAAVALADARAAQQAYVAAGQSSEYWIPKVATIVQEAGTMVDTLRGTAVSAAAGQALIDAASAVTEFGNVDKRVRDYLKADESLMASDVVFSEGTVAASRAAAQVETGRLAEHQAFDADEATLRRLEAYAIGGAAGLSGLILLILGLARGSGSQASVVLESETPPKVDEDELPLRESPGSLGRMAAKAPPQSASIPPSAAPAPSSLALKAAAALCTEFGRIRDLGELKMLLGRAARVMDANGLVVWLGNADGVDLQPVIAHGYSDQVLSLMRPVARTADNAAAAAYRSGALQTVASRAGSPLGAIVAPLLSADGCIGALTAEVKDGNEKSEQVQALASIFAAQLAGILASSAASATSEPRTAAR